MTMRKTRPLTQTAQARTGGDDPSGGEPNALQQQAAVYGNIARKALEDCKQGISADEALERRRNRSGQ